MKREEIGFGFGSEFVNVSCCRGTGEGRVTPITRLSVSAFSLSWTGAVKPRLGGWTGREGCSGHFFRGLYGLKGLHSSGQLVGQFWTEKMKIFSIFTVRTAFDSLVERDGEDANMQTRISRVPGWWRWSD